MPRLTAGRWRADWIRYAKERPEDAKQKGPTRVGPFRFLTACLAEASAKAGQLLASPKHSAKAGPLTQNKNREPICTWRG
jgi:hypothetical protein